jgi:hypothetical protein
MTSDVMIVTQAEIFFRIEPGGKSSPDQFPAAYKGSAFVALKGSWNRSEPIGYKVVRVPFRNGQPEGYYENFATGFWASGERRARFGDVLPRLRWQKMARYLWPTTPAERSGGFLTPARAKTRPARPKARGHVKPSSLCRIREPVGALRLPEKKKGRPASGDPSSTCSSSTFRGRLLDLCTGGLSPGRIQFGNHC